jgi:AmmeMemoRadiSam system protein A
MERMSSSERARLAPEDRARLLALARESIERGLGGARWHVRGEEFPEALRAVRATFVTLHVEGGLRGCIGTLEAKYALVEDVVRNAHSAAFEDPRFPALTRREFERLDLHISVLSPPEPVECRSEEELLAQLRPRQDGLIIEEGFFRGTFLPSVWEQLPEPRDFLRQLKLKAGLPEDYWSPRLRVRRYTTESVP